MATAPPNAERLRSRMQRIRNRMHTNVNVLRVDAESLSDWRFYVGKFPMASIAAAALAGFWLSPGRRVIPKVKLDEGSMDKLIERGALRVEATAPRRSAWWTPLVRMGADLAGNLILAWVGKQLVQHTAEEVREQQGARR